MAKYCKQPLRKEPLFLLYLSDFYTILINASRVVQRTLTNWGNLLKRVQWKKIYEMMKYWCCATKNEFNNTAWAQGFKKYLWASLFLHNPRVLDTFMILSRRDVLQFLGYHLWKHNEILCFQVFEHSQLMPWIQRAPIFVNLTSISKIICKKLARYRFLKRRQFRVS